MATPKKEKAVNWTFAETSLLLEEVGMSTSILLSKQSSNVTNKLKEERWQDIANRISSVHGTLRNEKACRRKWSEEKTKVLSGSKVRSAP